MDWYLILAIAVPFLFIIGVINNAIKDQRRLEKGKLQSYLQKRVAKREAGGEEEDDWGIQARLDLKRAVQEQEHSLAKDALQEQVAQTQAELSGQKPLSSVTMTHHQVLGNTNATNATDYFARYYKD